MMSVECGIWLVHSALRTRYSAFYCPDHIASNMVETESFW